jgi:ABC-type bacteriocin/lantibiotic exporter with double-glycine peptidase domain
MLRRYAGVQQTGQSDCAAAALATVALHYRRPIAIQQLRDLAETDQIGTNLLGLLHVAEALGFAAKGVQGLYEALSQVPLPAIAHVKTEEDLRHFLILSAVALEGERMLRGWKSGAYAMECRGHATLRRPTSDPTSALSRSSPMYARSTVTTNKEGM